MADNPTFKAITLLPLEDQQRIAGIVAKPTKDVTQNDCRFTHDAIVRLSAILQAGPPYTTYPPPSNATQEQAAPARPGADWPADAIKAFVDANAALEAERAANATLRAEVLSHRRGQTGFVRTLAWG